MVERTFSVSNDAFINDEAPNPSNGVHLLPPYEVYFELPGPGPESVAPLAPANSVTPALVAVAENPRSRVAVAATPCSRAVVEAQSRKREAATKSRKRATVAYKPRKRAAVQRIQPEHDDDSDVSYEEMEDTSYSCSGYTRRSCISPSSLMERGIAAGNPDMILTLDERYRDEENDEFDEDYSDDVNYGDYCADEYFNSSSDYQPFNEWEDDDE